MSFNPTRRDVLVGGLGAGLALPLTRTARLPRWLHALNQGDNILVVLQLRGGCDGLQCVAPIKDPVYQKARANFGIPADKGLLVDSNDSVYFHPSMADFKALYDRGDLAIVQGIGYPNPNLSHFRSEDIWASGDNAATTVNAGWLGTWRKTQYTGSFSIPMIDIEARRNDAFVGAAVPVFRSRADFQFFVDTSTTAAGLDAVYEKALIEANAKVARTTTEPNLAFVSKALNQTVSDMGLIQTTGTSYTPKVTYPSTDATTTRLSSAFQLAASYITGGMGTRVYYVDTGGFDTHANEIASGNPLGGNMATLVQRFSSCIKAFLDDLKAYGKSSNVIVMVTSEFGRRLGQNGTNGTDHGQASLSYVAGEPVKGGLYGKYPDLSPYASRTDFNKISLPFTTDFRSLYATVIDKWLGGDHTKVLPGTFPLLGLL